MKVFNKEREDTDGNFRIPLKMITDFLKIVISFNFLAGLMLVLFFYIRYQHGRSIFYNYMLMVRKNSTLKVINLFELVAPVVSITILVIIVFTAVFAYYYFKQNNISLAGRRIK
ncbi:MAG: hypothetical protein KKH98_13360 [Spirochaetes bacterium]|nr:hypothetical protein [Spirochaetota bacterium]